MAQSKCSTMGLTLAAVLTIGRIAAADPVQITSGYLTVTGAQDVMSRGFLRSISYDFTTESFRLSGFEGDGVTQNVFAPRLLIPSLWMPLAGSSDLVSLSSNLMFTTLPGPTGTPFQLSGVLSIFEWGSGATLFSDAVAGSGTATWQFVVAPAGNSVVSGVRYEFDGLAPVPEPATLILLAGGIAAAAARRKRDTG